MRGFRLIMYRVDDIQIFLAYGLSHRRGKKFSSNDFSRVVHTTFISLNFAVKGNSLLLVNEIVPYLRFLNNC